MTVSEEEAKLKGTILVVDDEESMRHSVSRALKRAGFDVQKAASAKDALTILQTGAYICDVVISDIRMPGMDGHELFAQVADDYPGTLTILMTGFGSIKDATAAMQRGAEGYLAKPFENEELVAAVSKAVEKARLLAENRQLRNQLAASERGTQAYAGMVGTSRAIKRLFHQIDLLAGRDGNVLITGESGTGKELAARALHARSERAGEPFVAVHCGALPDNLVAAELFGVEPGAFTGAEQARKGYIERAAGGTLFLDEISEIPLEVQPVLLRFLESGEVIRVGGSEVLRPDVRVIAASNRDLRLLVEQRRFRDDLFYRLNVLPLLLPPLRERSSDLPLLMSSFLTRVGRENLVIPPDVLAYLQGLPWPGNVRELRNLSERLAGTVEADTVTLEDIPQDWLGEGPRAEEGFRPYRLAMEQFERDYLTDLLERTGGNVSEAARIGGMGRPSLHARIGALGIDVAKFRARPKPRKG